MALLFMDSFDHYATADITEKYSFLGGGGGLNATGGRRGGGCFRFSSAGWWLITPSFPSTTTTCIAGAAYKFGNLDVYVFRVIGPSGQQFYLKVNGSGYLAAYRGGDQLLGTATIGQMNVNVFHYIEMKVVIHATTGSVIARVNNQEVLNLPTVNTAQSGVGWQGLQLQPFINGYNVDYDDFYICDSSGSTCNDFLGDCRIDARYPTAEGVSSAWSPLSGTDNALMVDDPGPPYTPGITPDDDTTYVSTATIGATDTHVTQDIPVAGASVLAVQHLISAKKSEAGSCAIAPVYRPSGGPDVPGTEVNVGTSYNYIRVPYSGVPGTGAAWTEAAFNASEFGYKRTT